jgi:AraC-like DNA-binding protein
VRARHLQVWVIVVGLSLSLAFGWARRLGIGAAVGRTLSIASLVLALLALVQTLATWKADLIAGRRRLRFLVLAGTAIYMALRAGSDLWPAKGSGFSAVGSLGSAVELSFLAILAQWSAFSISLESPGALPGPDRPILGAPREGSTAVDPALVRRLEHFMNSERGYRQEGLTIGALAAKLDLPEYRLRQVINEGLGHRNFNAFLNRYRIEEAKAALADPAQREVPILTIALDAGFQSVGPFNRAFKAETGVTPTEFRRRALDRC